MTERTGTFRDEVNLYKIRKVYFRVGGRVKKEKTCYINEVN